jgi:hypothetical protein
MAKTRRKLLKQFAILNASAKIAFPPKSTISLKIDFLRTHQTMLTGIF